MLPTRPRFAARSMCSSCGTPACITPTRVSCGVQLIRMSSVMMRDLELLDELRSLVERQPHDPRVAAVQLGDEGRGAALDRVGARLVGRLAALDVGFELGPRELAETHPALAHDQLGARLELERDRGQHAVLASGEEPQHARRVAWIGGLAENLLV